MMSQNNLTNPFLLNGKYGINDSRVSMFNDSLIKIEITQYIEKVNFYITIIEILMVICGIFGNGLALVVINRRSLRDTSSSVFITYLAIFDISVLLVQITSLASSYWVHSYIFHCFLAYLIDLVTFCSVWIMVIMTLERCVAVRSPFLAKRFCTAERARYSIFCLLLFACILFSSTFFIIYKVDKFQQKCNIRQQYRKILRFIKPTIFYFVPDILLLANLFVIYELFMAKRQRSQTLMNPENAISQLNAISFNRKQQQLTIMLVTVSLSFYFFTTPAIIDYIHQMNPPKFHDIKQLKMRLLMANISVLWLQMSSATNFIFYCLAGSKFRAATLDTFSDIYDFVLTKLGNNDNYVRRRRRQNKSDIRLSTTLGNDVRNGLRNDRNKHRSNSVPQTCIDPLINSAKRLSNETIVSSQLNSRPQSKTVLNVDEV